MSHVRGGTVLKIRGATIIYRIDFSKKKCMACTSKRITQCSTQDVVHKESFEKKILPGRFFNIEKTKKLKVFCRQNEFVRGIQNVRISTSFNRAVRISLSPQVPSTSPCKTWMLHYDQGPSIKIATYQKI